MNFDESKQSTLCVACDRYCMCPHHRFVLDPLETNELTTSTSHEHDARDSSQELTGTRARLGQQRALAFDLPSIVKGQQSLQLEHNAPSIGAETYETQAPIRIDLGTQHMATPRVVQETTTTRSRNNAQVQEYTTRAAYRERTEPPVKVSLPVEEYTQTIITTRHPLNEKKPLEPIPEEFSEEEKEEEEEATTERPRTAIPKKVPLRQEGARTQTGGTRTLSHQSTYSMPAVTNYDPQANSNLEGLSPPVDPTYFTYNSQHLGRRRQFAVNSVPFDKNVPNPAGFVPFANRQQVGHHQVEEKLQAAPAHDNENSQHVFSGGSRSVLPTVNQPTGFNLQPVNQPAQFNSPPTQQNVPQFTPQFNQQQQQQQFVQQQTNFNQQPHFVPPQQNNFNAPRPVTVTGTGTHPSVGSIGQPLPRVTQTAPLPRTEVFRSNEVRNTQPPVQQPTSAPAQQTVSPTWRSPPPHQATFGRGPALPHFENDHAPRTPDFTTERTVTRQDTRDPVKFIPSQRNTASSFVPSSTSSPIRSVDPRFEEDKFRFVSSQGPRFVMDEFSPEEPVQPARSRARQTVQTTRGGQQITAETPRPTTTRSPVGRQIQPKPNNEPIRQSYQPNEPVRQTYQPNEPVRQSFQPKEPVRQIYQPLQNAVKTVVTQEKLPLNTLPIHKIDNVAPLVPKRIQFKEHASEEKVPIVHGIRSGPYGQTHWVYFDGDYYGPLIPGVKVNRTGVEKIDATVAVQGIPSHEAAYESFKYQASNFQKSLDMFIKQKEQEQLKRDLGKGAGKTTTTHTPFSRNPQGVVMIPVENGPNEEPLVIPVLRTENVRFKDVNKHAEQKLTKDIEKGLDNDILQLPKFLQSPPRTNQHNSSINLNSLSTVTNTVYDNFQHHVRANSSILLGEESEEASREEEEPVRRPVVHGVSHVRVAEPLPVENYHSPEPILRGAYGKKYLEPATTQGVKINTSTARSTTTTTTPTTTASTTSTTTTVRTTTKIEEVEEKIEEVEEEEPEEITTTAGSTSTVAATTTTEKVLEQPKEELPVEVKEIVREESSAQQPQESQAQPETPEQETEDDEEPEEIPEPNTVPTSRASRLPASREESKTEEDETEEDIDEENASTPITSPETEVDVTEASTESSSIQESTTVGTEATTEEPEVETTLFNEVNSMEGEEGVEENEITPSSMMSSSKFAVHRQTKEEQKFEEITADLKSNPDERAETNTPLPGLKKVEITRPTTVPSTATAPTNEAPTTEAAVAAESVSTTVESVSTTAEASTTSGTIQPKALNIEITDSTTSASSTASTTQAPTTATSTQSRAPTTTTGMSLFLSLIIPFVCMVYTILQIPTTMSQVLT